MNNYISDMLNQCVNYALKDLVKFSRLNGKYFAYYYSVRKTDRGWAIEQYGQPLYLVSTLREAREVIARMLGYTKVSNEWLSLHDIAYYVQQNGIDFQSWVDFGLEIYARSEGGKYISRWWELPRYEANQIAKVEVEPESYMYRRIVVYLRGTFLYIV